MLHRFTKEVAIEYGLSVAVFLENIAFWTLKNVANKKHYYDSHYWSYNSYEAFSDLLPYFSIQNIRTIIKKCIDEDLIITGNYNKTHYDRTNWYALTPKALAFFPELTNLINTHLLKLTNELNIDENKSKPFKTQASIDLLELTNGSGEINRPIPDNKPDHKQDLYIDHSSDDTPPIKYDGTPPSLANASSDARDLFDDFWDLYPVKKGKAKAHKAWIKQKLDKHFEAIVEKLKLQIENDVQWQNKQFIPHGDTYVRNAMWEDEIQLPEIKETPVAGKESVTIKPYAFDLDAQNDMHDRKYGLGKYAGQGRMIDKREVSQGPKPLSLKSLLKMIPTNAPRNDFKAH